MSHNEKCSDPNCIGPDCEGCKEFEEDEKFKGCVHRCVVCHRGFFSAQVKVPAKWKLLTVSEGTGEYVGVKFVMLVCDKCMEKSKVILG